MRRIVTLADHRFRREVEHLQRSLALSNPDTHLTVYCDDRSLFADLASERCFVIELPEMSVTGAKRSKLTAFRHAIDSGSFLYLDADAIVLESLAELWESNRIAGCADDLSHCPFITDKQHPWPNAPELVNRLYINSGIFFAPASSKPFFDDIYEQSRTDSVWQTYIFPEKLFDNHFLCAHLNLKGEPVGLLDSQVYGWQGFLQHGLVQVERRDEQLVNRINGKVLKIVLFAGVRQSYDFLLSQSPEISSLILHRILPSSESLDYPLAQYLATASSKLSQVADPHASTILRNTLAELRHLVDHADVTWRRSRSYYNDPESVRAFACAQPSSESEWNGLKCGGAYLEGEEYNAIRDITKNFDIHTVLETGAGESSILFSRLGMRSVSVEWQPGPWLDRARAEGCTVLAVPYDETLNSFADNLLRFQIKSTGLDRVDLLFIDSPVGTARRRGMLSQFIQILPIRYVLYHDAIRDSANIFRDQNTFGLRLVKFVDSGRGLVLLENTGQQSERGQQLQNQPIDPLRVQVRVDDTSLRTCRAGEALSIQVTVDNQGTGQLSSNLKHPVFGAYHWANEQGEMVVFDGIRTPLPFDIRSGDACRFFLDVIAPDQPGSYQLQISLVQEMVCWFHHHNEACLISIPVNVEASDSVAVSSQRAVASAAVPILPDVF